MSSIQKHWKESLPEHYQAVVFETFAPILNYLEKNSDPILIMFDEMSSTYIFDALKILEKYTHAKVLLFNAVPEVHHASSLLGLGIKGYENTYIAKENVEQMLATVENGHNWLFSDLTHYIINQYVKTNNKNEPKFMSLLTEKEKDIALMIADGLCNKEIAQKEKIALSTVKGHIHHIFEKAGVTDRVALVLQFK